PPRRRRKTGEFPWRAPSASFTIDCGAPRPCRARPPHVIGTPLTMSLLGKILAALNLIGAVVLVVLGAMDYGKRQAFGYAALERETLLRGLPLNDQETDLHGNVRANQLSAATRQELFGGLRTQLEAVEELKQATDKFVGAGPDKAAALARVLLPLA